MLNSVTSTVVDFALCQTKIPDSVRKESWRAFVNWLGCALGGAKHPATICALKSCQEFSNLRNAAIIGHNEALDPSHAAFINCLASSILSFDDTHLPTITHPTGPVAAAIMALAKQEGLSGKELLETMSLCIEIECRLSKALLMPPAESKIGWYVTGLTGGIAAALAASRVLGLTQKQATWALGIASSMASGFRQVHGTMSIGLAPAHAARCGVQAAILAGHGFTCSPLSLEGQNGFFDVFSNIENVGAVTRSIGEQWEILRNTYKPYPCGIVIHPAIDACLDISQDKNLNLSDINNICLVVSPTCIELCDRPNPRDSYEAGVSVQHWAAATLTRGSAGLSEAGEECVHDLTVARLRNLIHLQLDDNLDREAAHVEIRFNSNPSIKKSVTHCRGSYKNPLSDEEIKEKFLQQACEVLTKVHALQLLNKLELMDNLPVSELILNVTGNYVL